MANISISPVSDGGDWWGADPVAPQAGAPGGGGGGRFAAPISSIESGGNYRAVGPVTRDGDRAFGKYQVMGKNIGPWSKEVLGREVSRQEFVTNPEIQDQIFNAKFGSYAEKYGPEGAARAWFAGEGGMNDPNRRDVLGTTVANYAAKFSRALGPGEANAAPVAQQPQTAPAQASAGQWWDSDPVAPQQPQAQEHAPAAPQSPDIGRMTALGEGLRSGATLNFGDELAGASAAGFAGLPIPKGVNVSLLAQALGVPIGVGRMIAEAIMGQGGQATQAYEAKRDQVRADQKASQEQYPGTYLAGQVGGAVALPVGGALNAATLPARIGRGALVGGGVGAVAGAGEGETLPDRAGRAVVGAGLGTAVGATAPVAIEGIVRGGRRLVEPMVNARRGVFNRDDEAARRVAIALERDVQADPNAVNRLTPTEFAMNAGQGGPARVMDIGGDTTRALARSAANTSPEGRGVLNRAIDDRYEGQSGRVVAWLQNTFHFPNADAQQQALQQTQRAVNRGAYARAYRDGDRPLWSPELERLAGSPAVEDALRSAIRTGKDRAVNQGFGGFRVPITVTSDGRVTFNRGPNGVPTYPNLQFWDYARREISDAASAAQRAGRNEEASRLGDLSRALNAELDRLVPSYQQARAGAARFFGAEDALEAGQNFVRANLSNAETRRALAQMTPVERQLFQDGFVSRFIETLNQVGDRRNVLNQIASSPAAREKLRIALGPQRADELEAVLRIEGVMDLARSAVQGNSTTARQLAELGLAGGAYGIGSGGNFNPLDPNPQALMGAMLVYGAARGRNAVNDRLSQRVAEMLVSRDPNVILQGVRVVARNRQMFDSLRAVDRRIAQVGGEQVPSGAVPALQAPGAGRAGDQDQPSVPRPPGQ